MEELGEDDEDAGKFTGSTRDRLARCSQKRWKKNYKNVLLWIETFKYLTFLELSSRNLLRIQPFKLKVSSWEFQALAF